MPYRSVLMRLLSFIIRLLKNRVFLLLVKIIIGVAPWVYVYCKLQSFDLSRFFTVLGLLGRGEYLLFVCVGGLMVVNWSVEAFKWQFATRGVARQSFSSSLVAVVAGVSLGLITPNRVGEFAGRVLMLPPGTRRDGLAVMTACSLAQLTVTVIFGCIALPFFPWHYVGLPETSLLASARWFGIPLAVIILSLYLSGARLSAALSFIKFNTGFSLFMSRLAAMSFHDLVLLFVLSLIRYGVFVMQFCIVLYVFSFHISVVDACVAVALLYAVTTIVPTTTLAELGLRSGAALFFIGAYSSSNEAIVLATFIVWIINIAIPSLFGAYFILFRRELSLPSLL